MDGCIGVFEVVKFHTKRHRAWLFTDTLWPAQSNYFALRTVWIQYSGVLAIGHFSKPALTAT